MKAKHFLPESEILHHAHEAAIKNSSDTISFFILLTLLSTVSGFLFGWLLGLIVPFLGLFAGLICKAFLGYVFEYSTYVVGIKLVHGEKISTSDVFCGMRDYGRVMPRMLWFHFRTFLWSVVPVFGWIKVFGYMLTPYLLHIDPELSAEEALKKSEELTHGHKLELCVVWLKFTGWRILNFVSLGLVGYIYFYAYDAAVWADCCLHLSGEETAIVRTSESDSDRVVPDISVHLSSRTKRHSDHASSSSSTLTLPPEL